MLATCFSTHKKTKTLGVGIFPHVSLKQARIARDDTKEKPAKNISLSLDKKRKFKQ